MSIITNLRDRNNIKVYNHGTSRVCLTTNVRGYEFDGAKDGVPSMFIMSFSELEYANSKNPNLFVTGMLTFDEREKDEIYNALNHTDWRERIWTEASIEDAIMHPTVEKMNRIFAVRDIPTIDRIHGKMIYLCNTSDRRPIESVIEHIEGRRYELYEGKKQSTLVAILPEDIKADDKEKERLKAENEDTKRQLKELQEQMAKLMQQVQVAPTEQVKQKPQEKKPAGRPKKTT